MFMRFETFKEAAEHAKRKSAQDNTSCKILRLLNGFGVQLGEGSSDNSDKSRGRLHQLEGIINGLQRQFDAAIAEIASLKALIDRHIATIASLEADIDRHKVWLQNCHVTIDKLDPNYSKTTRKDGSMWDSIDGNAWREQK